VRSVKEYMRVRRGVESVRTDLQRQTNPESDIYAATVLSKSESPASKTVMTLREKVLVSSLLACEEGRERLSELTRRGTAFRLLCQVRHCFPGSGGR
jgi:hypothetical protein